MKNPCLASRGLCVVLAAALAVVILGVPRAGAQVSPTLESYLRVEFTVEPSKGGRLRLSGYVYNTWDKWATDVRLSAEALDEAGQVVGSTAVAVYGKVPPGNRSYFDVPLTTAGARYRVTVRSVEWRTFGAGGG